jgi:ELWxxDGT repeat protein
VCFAANQPATGLEPWQTDGTGAGIVLIQDIYPGTTGSNPTYLTTSGVNLFFTATDAAHASRLWYYTH